MKPTFALNLSNERVGLLHRTGRGWMQVGEVAFDTPDLSEALAYLRRTALGLSPNGVTTKLVIPNSEILYCDVEAPGPDDDTRRTQIRAGLAGRTPYDPADLVFDWRGKGTMVKVAVVARETLVEAEAFAVEHRFGPVCFVALPEPSQFKGEPFFGMTEAAKTILPTGETVEHEREAMTIVTRNLPLADLPPESEERPARRSERAEKSGGDALSSAVEKLRAQPSAPPRGASPDPVPAPPPIPSAPPPAEVPAEVPPPIPPVIPPADPELPDAPPVPVQEPPASPPTRFGGVGAAAVSAPNVVEEAPFAEVDDLPVGRGKLDPDDDLPPAPSKAAQMAFASRRSEDTRATAPGTTNGKAFAGLPGAARDDGLKRAVPPLRNDAQVTSPSIPGSKKRKAVPVTQPPAVAAAAAALATGNSMGKPTKPLTRPGGTFGAKPLPQRGKPRYLGLILTGVLLIVLALIAAWSSYSLVQNDGVTTDTATATADAPSIDDEMASDQQDAALPSDVPASDLDVPASDLTDAPSSDLAAVEDAPASSVIETPVSEEPAAPAELAEPQEQDAAALAGEATDFPLGTEAGSAEVLADDAPLGTEAAATGTEAAPDTTIATPDVAPSAPEGLAAPQPAPAPAEVAVAPDLGLATAAAGPEPRAADVPEDALVVATSDTAPEVQAALTLPVPVLTNDAAPAAAPPPPPFGTVYQFDANGLIRPTEEGIMAPDGYMLFAGPPPLTPPPRSAAALAAAAALVPAPAADPAAAIATAAAASLANPAAVGTAAAPPPAADPAMAEFRPRPRPATLTPPAPVQNADDASLGDAQVTQVAMLTPRARPTIVSSSAVGVLEGAAAASLTAQANAAVEAALASAAETGNVMTLAVSRRPAARPQDLSRAVNAAVAAAVRTAEPNPEIASDVAANDAVAPEGDAEPETVSVAPRIPTKTSVAKQATFANAINLSKVNLIGVYGTPSKRYALVRLSSGRYKKVSVGDSVDGGRVEAITASEVRYQKSGRLVALKMPRT